MDITDPPIDYQALASSMGVPAQRIDKVADIRPAVEAAIASGQPGVIEIVVETE